VYTSSVMISIVMISSRSVSTRSRMGQMKARPPLTIRYGSISPVSLLRVRRPEMIRTSFGPTFLTRLA